MEYLILILTLGLILFAELVNGWTDAPNAIATVVSTRTLSMRSAIFLATSLNILGAFVGTAVATTIGQDIVKTEVLNLGTLSSALIAIIFWGILAWRLGLPTSKSHALIAGLTGAGFAVGGLDALIWTGWAKVLIGLFFSLALGMIGGWAIAKTIQVILENGSPGKCRKAFAHLQMISAGFMAFSHGSNDGQKFIGIFTLALLLGGQSSIFEVSYWVIVLCALVMGIGTSIGGLRIIKTMGFRILKLETYQGFSAEMAAASTIMTASFLGIPLSTTHTIGSAIIGTGIAKRPKSVRWKVVSHIIYAWIITFPMCGIIAFVSAWLFKILLFWGLLLFIIIASITIYFVNKFFIK